MKPPLDGTILITGASAGIGEELARQLAFRAKTLVLAARRVERLEKLGTELKAAASNLRIEIVPVDLSDRNALSKFADEVERRVGEVDVLINNAGLGNQALFDEADWERLAPLIDVNVAAPTYLSHRFVRPMVARGRGGILNISSGAGLTLMGGAAVYTATKHYLSALTDTLRAEVMDRGVVVSQSLPGPVDTEFDQVAGMEGGMAGGPPQSIRITAPVCAKETLDGFERGAAMIFPGFAYRQMMRMGRMMPRAMFRNGARKTARSMRKPPSGG